MQCLLTSRTKILVSVPQQRLLVFSEEGTREAQYPISTAKRGLGEQEGSFQTPRGLFQVSEKYGAGQPLYTLYKSRKVEGQWHPEENEPSPEDLILTRILRLSGLGAANHNTYGRYIYIHGTNHENQLGQPVSHGCIRMGNRAVMNLYNQVSLGTVVFITNRPHDETIMP